MRIWLMVVAVILAAGCNQNMTQSAGDMAMTETTKINYIELPVTDLAASKDFYARAFGWSYVDYGPTYASFTGAGIDGGMDADADRKPSKDGALVVLYAKDLEAAQAAVEAANGKITIPIFTFPGGRRFHFTDPSGNELAVWVIEE